MKGSCRHTESTEEAARVSTTKKSAERSRVALTWLSAATRNLLVSSVLYVSFRSVGSVRVSASRDRRRMPDGQPPFWLPTRGDFKCSIGSIVVGQYPTDSEYVNALVA